MDVGQPNPESRPNPAHEISILIEILWGLIESLFRSLLKRGPSEGTLDIFPPAKPFYFELCEQQISLMISSIVAKGLSYRRTKGEQTSFTEYQCSFII